MAEMTYRQIVREIAIDSYGYVTTTQAVAAGVPAIELPKLAARGGLDHVAYGLYRVPDLPSTAYDQFAEALLRVGEGAYLHGESVLALLGLADVNPRHIKVAVPRRARPSLPPFVELTHVKADMRTTLYEGLSRELHRSAGERALPRAANPEPLRQRRPRPSSPGRDGARRGRSDASGGRDQGR